MNNYKGTKTILSSGFMREIKIKCKGNMSDN